MRTIDGPTPAGGVRAVGTYTDVAGREVEPDDPAAYALEIHELDDDGSVLARHYGLLEGPGGYLPDEDDGDIDGNEDQAKGTWDLWAADGHGVLQPVETLDQLLRSLGWEAHDLSQQRSLVATMLPLPSWEQAPEPLKAEVSAWLTRTRPEPGDEPHPMQPTADAIAGMLQVPPIDAAAALGEPGGVPIGDDELAQARAIVDEVDAED